MIKNNENNYPIALMCRCLQVSESGYYDWRSRPDSNRTRENKRLTKIIAEVFYDEKCRVGSPRITKRLEHEGIVVDQNSVAKLMQKAGMRAKNKRKFKATTNSNHHLPVSPNLLKQNFSASAPNKKWVSDITYIWTSEGWLYLAGIVDLYSRMVVGWAVAERMTTQLVCEALQMALWRRKHPKNVIIHSDRGSQYCSKEYQKMLKEHHLISSMSKRGDCYDNALMESWNHSFKVEAIHGERFATRAIAKAQIFEYIEVYYNRKRLHSSLGYCSPMKFEEQLVA